MKTDLNVFPSYTLIATSNKELKLPSDDEILKEIKSDFCIYNEDDFFNGAKWMKEQILNQNK